MSDETAENQQDGTRGSILVVDDDPSARAFVRTALSAAGYVVHGAAGGREALRKMRRERFDLVLLDVVMPDMDGYSVLDELRSASVDARVVMITGRDDLGGIQRETAAGAVDHLNKPFGCVDLEIVVDGALALAPDDLETRRQTLSRSAALYSALSELNDLARRTEA